MKFSSIFYPINLDKTIRLKPSFRLALQVTLYLWVIFFSVFFQRAFSQVANFGNFYIPAGGSVSVPVSFTNNAVANYVNDGTMILAGSITNNQPSLSPANGTTTLTGTALQTIGGTQPFYAHNFTLNKNNYTQLDASIFVNGILTLDNGILNTASDKLLVLQSTSSIAGSPSANAFVNGPMVWQTDVARQYDFPVGKTTPFIQYQPVSLVRTTAVGNASFTAEFVAASPIGPQYGNVFADPILQGIFSNRYWTVAKDYIPVDASDKGAEARLMINYAGNPGPSGWVPLEPNATSNVAVASWSPAVVPTADVPGYWAFTKNGFDFNTGGGTYPEAIYNMSAGPVYSSPVTSFNAFTIGFGSGFILPAILLSFDAALVNGTDGRLRWAVSDAGSLAGFELFHSTDGSSFTHLSSIPGNGGVTYSYTHSLLVQGKHYYKLRLQDKDGTFRYSAVKVLQVDKGGTYIKGIRSTLIDKDIRPIIFSAGTQKANIIVIDAAGKSLFQQQLTLQNGANEYPIRIGQLAAGIYFLRVATADGVAGSLQFLKK